MQNAKEHLLSGGSHRTDRVAYWDGMCMRGVGLCLDSLSAWDSCAVCCTCVVDQFQMTPEKFHQNDRGD